MAGAAGTQGSPAPRRRRRSRSASLALLLAALAVPLLLLALLEGLLRVADVGDLPPGQASKLRYQQVYPPLLEAGARPDGSAAFVTNDARMPWQAVARDKPPGGLRVVAVGGSATAGLGYSPNVSFARELERLLAAAQPGRPIEMLNLGVVAFSSAQVRWVVDDVCRSLQPDVVLVYCGNNEFLEIHAQKFIEAGAAAGAPRAGLGGLLHDTNLFRLLGGLARDARRGRDVTIADMAQAQARVSESAMMRSVSLTRAEHEGIVAAYDDNLRAMVASAAETGSGLLLMTVASNWQWNGREDLPDDWIDELLGSPPATGADLERALSVADERLAAASPAERHAWLYKRGLLLSRLDRWGEARDALRAAMNEDPRQRRASDELAGRVRTVAAETGAPLLDTIEWLGARAEHGLIGEAEFYDYVHFTPRGCVLVAQGVFGSLVEQGLVQPAPGFDLGAYVAARIAAYEALTDDPLPIGDWLGVGEISKLHDRELWKHQFHVRQLDERLAQAPDDVDALVRRANADFFSRDGFDTAVRRYERALELEPGHAAAAANLQILRTTRRP
jgi:tetratricopeptide (TPR) repeat protein